MQVTIDIPDWLATEFATAGKEPARAILEALAVEGYRTGLFGDGGAKQILGYGTRMQVHELLKEYDVYLNYSSDQLQKNIETADGLARTAQSESVAT